MPNFRRLTLANYVIVLVVAAGLLLLWPGLLRNLFTSAGYEPHGTCFLWQPNLVWLFAISDSLIGFAYIAISATLAYFVYRLRDELPLDWIFIAFGVFILACGGTHLMDVWTLWTPNYWLSGYMRLITAAASIMTAVLLPPLIPPAWRVIVTARLSEDRRLQLEAANVELTRLYKQSVELTHIKSQFFTNANHELRTPLALILGPLETLLDADNLTEDQRITLARVQRNAQSLYSSVDDLLDVSKLEAGKMPVNYTQCDLAEIVRSTAAQFESLAEKRQIVLTVMAYGSLFIQTDDEKIRRIVLNLLSNAFKFTPDGGAVRCSVAVNADSATINIEDNGPGIPIETRDSIFEPFQQGSARPQYAIGSSGLGLAIVKEFIDLLGGSVTVTDTPGGGATFRLQLPRQAPAGTSIAPTLSEPLSERLAAKLAITLPAPPVSAVMLPEVVPEPVQTVSPNAPVVLVVEDNPDLRSWMVQLLQTDYRVLTAGDGQQGLDRALSESPDVIVTDVMMPNMSGDTFIHKLRTYPELSLISVLVLTARADEEMRNKLLRNGAQDYLLKPFSPQELHARLQNLIEVKRTRQILQVALTSQANDIAELATLLAARQHELELTVQSLKMSEERFKQLSDSDMIGVMVTDFNGRIMDANDALLEMLGYARADVTDGALNWIALTPTADLAQDFEIIEQIRTRGRYGPWEKTYIHKSGRLVPILMGAALLDGSETTTVCFVLDLTQRKQTENALRLLSDAGSQLAASLDFEATLNTLVRLLMPTMAECVLVDVVEDDGNLRRAIRAISPMCADDTYSALEGETVSIQRVISTGEAALLSPGVTADDGDPIREALAMSLPLTVHGRTIGALSLGCAPDGLPYTYEDLTVAQAFAERVAMALDNSRLYSESQRAIEVRDEFLSVAAHELKTPVTSLRGFAQLLLRRIDKAQTVDIQATMKILKTIDQQSAKMGDLVVRLLDVSRLESNKLSLQRQLTDVAMLVRTAAETLQRNTQKHTVTVSGVQSIQAMVDPLRLEQVLINLIDNAIKYSPDGGPVTVEVSTPDPAAVQISVTDRGMGIPIEHRAHIFVRFYQAHSRSYLGGMGLGLYISREIVELHGGQIRAEFPEAGGTRFIVTLPLDGGSGGTAQ